MERALLHRDTIGVEDFVLLEDVDSEAAFVDNLQKRFNADLIYTYIGPVLVSVNPYKELGIYGPETIAAYQGVNYYEQAPHIFAVIDGALTSMTEETRDQCILISGESGSGKTEASKKILQYIGAVCSRSGHEVESVRDRLIQSNPLLEAFGNAKTVRNDNSSRFGKYMDVEFNFLGEPTGGHIRNYLLEKSRVVSQAAGECNFHMFHLLLAGASDQLLKELCLERDPAAYSYTKTSVGVRHDLHDAAQYSTVLSSMETVGFVAGEQRDVQAIVAAILHLGNVTFREEEATQTLCSVHNTHVAERVAKVLGVPLADLQRALTHRTIEAQTDVVTTTLGTEQGMYARDALSKAVYDRLFSWLVQRLNTSLASQDRGARHMLLGILDIYGFEVSKTNSFEQFCINFCNEKLQQLFIELTLKSEQEEYLAEGIAWVPVQYFNNKIICDMIELKHTGIVSLLDEECLRPGEATDLTFLSKMTTALRTHPHFLAHESADNKIRKTIARDEFRLMHYAGDVTYKVGGFMDKNNDLLYRDLKEAMAKSSNKIVQELFPASELQRKKMPETVSTQFKKSLDQLMASLMSKEPSYVRCIKPNDTKQSHVFSGEIVRHQVKYLGLMENLRVRRAGFAYRRPFEPFLQRYKSLCPATWPSASGPPARSVDTLMQHLGYSDQHYSMGKTKIFIRLPRTIFEVEDAFQARKHDLVTLITKVWRGRRQRLRYQRQREAAIVLEKYMRRHLARKQAERRRWAVGIVRRFITGFMTRNGPVTEVNRRFVAVVRREWLLRLARALPSSLLERRWPPAPPPCAEADALLRPLHRTWLMRKYVRALPAARKYQLQQKVLAESLFKGKKAGYERTIPEPFTASRLSADQEPLRAAVLAAVTKVDNSQVQYVAPVTKYDRHGYKPRPRWLVVTRHGVCAVDAHDKPRLKDRFALDNMSVTVTAVDDQLVIIKKLQPDDTGKEKGDLILICPHVIELVTKLAEITDRKVAIEIAGEGEKSLKHAMRGGKAGTIELVQSPQGHIHKEKTGHLVVTHG